MLDPDLWLRHQLWRHLHDEGELKEGRANSCSVEGKDLTKACSRSVRTRHFRGDQFTVSGRG
jgi:hypothetical protein